MSTDDISFGGISDYTEVKLQNEDPPKDRCHFVYIIFFFIGIGTLLPWNFFITAHQYFQYQLRNRSLSSDVDPLNPHNKTQLQILFPSYLAIASNLPAALANFANLLLKDCIPVFTRLVGSAVVMLIMFIITTVLTKLSVDTNIFFVLTLVTVAINNTGSSFYQGSTFGVLSVLPRSNARALLEGQAVAGIIAAVASLITIASSSNLQDVGFAYFFIAVIIIAVNIGLFVILFRTAYFKYYWRTEGSMVMLDGMSSRAKTRRTVRNLWHSMWEVRWTGFTTLLACTITLAVFPSVLTVIIPLNYGTNMEWKVKYFHPVIVFLSYSVFDYLGRALVGWIKWPTFEQRKLLLGLAIARSVFIPLVMFCNLGSHRIPAVFLHDSIPIIIVILLGLTNGYFVSLAVNYAPRYALPGDEEGCGIATATYITLGLCLGVILSYGLVAAI